MYVPLSIFKWHSFYMIAWKSNFRLTFFFLLLDSSRCGKKSGYNCIVTCTEFWKVKELYCRMYYNISADSQKFWWRRSRNRFAISVPYIGHNEVWKLNESKTKEHVFIWIVNLHQQLFIWKLLHFYDGKTGHSNCTGFIQHYPDSLIKMILHGVLESCRYIRGIFKQFCHLGTVLYTRLTVRVQSLTLTFQSLAVSLCTTRFNIQKFYMALALLWVFYTDIRTDSNFCFRQHKVIGFYDRGGKCLLCGTNWVFK